MRAKKFGETRAIFKSQRVALRAVHKRNHGEVDESWPALPVRARDICHGELRIRVWAKIVFEQADGISQFLRHVGRHRGRRKIAEIAQGGATAIESTSDGNHVVCVA